MKPYTITPRPPHRDVLLERDGSPLVIVRYREGAPDPAGEALAEARRIARAEAVIEAARRWRAAKGLDECVTTEDALVDAIDAYDGQSAPVCEECGEACEDGCDHG